MDPRGALAARHRAGAGAGGGQGAQDGRRPAGGPARQPDRAPATGGVADRRCRPELDAAHRGRRSAARARTRVAAHDRRRSPRHARERRDRARQQRPRGPRVGRLHGTGRRHAVAARAAMEHHRGRCRRSGNGPARSGPARGRAAPIPRITRRPAAGAPLLLARPSGHGGPARVRPGPARAPSARTAGAGGRRPAAGHGRRLPLDARHRLARLHRRRGRGRDPRRGRRPRARPGRRLRRHASGRRRRACRCGAAAAGHRARVRGTARRAPSCLGILLGGRRRPHRWGPGAPARRSFRGLPPPGDGRRAAGGRRRCSRSERRGLPRARVLGQRRVRASVPGSDPSGRGSSDARVPRSAAPGGAARGASTGSRRGSAAMGVGGLRRGRDPRAGTGPQR